jgi:uronate dehydrogenase
MVSPFERLLLTGAGGGLGRVLRPHLRQWARVARVSDRVDCDAPAAGE